MKSGDEVSYDGRLYILESTEGAATNRPITATIRDKRGKLTKVQFKELRPAATPRPAKFLKEESTCSRVGQFVMGEMAGTTGVVIDQQGGELVVHVHAPNHSETQKRGNTVWLPVWEHGRDGEQTRSKRAPEGTQPMIKRMAAAAADMFGELTATYRMTPDTRKEALARGLM
jgi:23S rRNA G2069 N7-methylase RlmK/C1962 C5-methylase RlmI